MIFVSQSKRRGAAIGLILCSLYAFYFCDVAFAGPQDRGGIGLQADSSPQSPSRLLPRNRQGTFTIHGYVPGSVTAFSSIAPELEIDSFDAPVLIHRTIMDNDLQPPAVMSFDEYLSQRQEEQFEDYWQEYAALHVTENPDGTAGPGGINLEIPVKIKSKTFQKIFGSGKVGLIVTGDIRMQAGLRRENRSEVRDALTRGSSTNFKMQQTQRFSVTGKIGEKVTVNVDQDSERAFEFDNNVKLVYQGFDDEILQRFEAGNIALSLPGTRYVTFSGKNSGLFGLKAQMKLGSLDLTTIASQEKGESQKLSLSGGATAGKHRIEDYRFMEGLYFFLDSTYVEQYRFYDADGNHQLQPNIATPIIPDSIEVYKAAAGYEEQFPDKVIPGFATFDGTVADPDNFETIIGDRIQAQFIRLEKTEYFVENDLGYIRLNTPLQDSEILAVAYKTLDQRILGDLNFVRDTTSTRRIVLKLIRDRSPLPTHRTYNLEWKHVYSLGSRNITEDGFRVIMFNKPSSGSPQQTDPNGRFWLNIFGLDSKNLDGGLVPDGEVDNDINIVDLARGEIHFRDLRPFDPVGYFVDRDNNAATPPELVLDLADADRTPEIYDQTDQSIIQGASNFYLEVETQNRGTEYNLGFNVIDGSEIVTLDGQTLQKGRDYTIDYFSGQLILLNERASNPSSQLDISYERNQLFQLEKKTILGMRAEYNLGRDSFIGGTVLYLNESTLDRKVRVGRGPMRNLVWDLNTRLKFQPNFIGKAFDFLPLIRAKGETSLNFEGEIAQVMPTPNTLNSPDTGDNRGVAYIDDFEAAKKSTNLGVLRQNWTLASQPRDGVHSFRNRINNFIWYNPVDQVPIKDIFPNREININRTETSQHVLTIDIFDPEDAQPDTSRWTGVMRALSPGLFDQSQTKFIEIMVQGNAGRVHLDLGSISEDIIPNNRLDSEDIPIGGARNGILDPGEDLGIDGVSKRDPPELNFPRKVTGDSSAAAVPYDFWDVNRDGLKNADEPWSYDDWFYPELSRQYITIGTGSINGMEVSQNDASGRTPDTEDMNGNGIVDLADQYFSFSFSLSPDHPDTSLIVGGNPNNPENRGGPWKLYRIPLDPTTADLIVGNPTTSLIEFVRIWVDSLDYNLKSVVSSVPDFARISIAEIDLVGSDWKEVGLTQNENDLSSGLIPPDQIAEAFKITQINTHENQAYFESLNEIGVQGEEDPVTGVRAREQSLVLRANRLEGGFAAIAQKSLFQGESYIHYDRIRMFVHGIDEGMTHFAFMTEGDSSAVSQLEYFVRFGANRDNYYEYRSLIYPGWDDRNQMDLPLLEFTSIDRLDSLQANGGNTFFDDSTGTFIKILGPGKQIRVKGKPSFTNVRILTLGIRNKLDNTPFVGDIWFNELRLTEVDQDAGMAMRARADLKIGNFATINGEIEDKDADFHNVATRFGNGNNTRSSNFNANINVDRMLPQWLGIAMPLSINYRNSESDPKYFPGLDRAVTSSDLSDAGTLALIQNKTRQTGFNLSFRRQAKSRNFLVRNTIDNISMTLGKSKNTQVSPTIAESRNVAWNGSFDYRLDFGRNNYFSPLKWLPNLPFVNKAKDTKMYYTPQNISVRLNGNKRNSFRQNRIANSNLLAAPNETEDFIFDRSIRTTMKVFESLTLDFSRAHKAQMRDKSFSDFLHFNFEDINQTQSFSARYSPRVFSWLSNNFSYNANYRFNNNLQNKTTGRSASNDITRSADVTFNWKQLVSTIFGGGKATRGPRRGGQRGRPGARGRGGTGGTQNEAQLNFLQEKGSESSGGFNPLKAVGSFFSNFKDIQLSYSEREGTTHTGLDSTFKPSLAFQFGLSDTTGVGTISNLSTNPITQNKGRNLSLGSGLALGRAVDVGLRFQHSNTRTTSRQITGNTSNSWLSEKGFDMPFPEWNVRITGLQVLPLFKKLFNNVTFSHAFTGRKDTNWIGDSDNKTNESISSNFRPLGKLDLTFKNGFSGNIQFNRTRTLTTTFTQGQELGANRNSNQDVTFTANYSKRSGFRLPIWPFNKAELKNSIDFSFSFSASTTTQENRQVASAEFVEANKTTRWSASPRLTYSFSNTVRGSAFVEVGKTNSKRVGSTTIQEFGIDINIAIRGN